MSTETKYPEWAYVPGRGECRVLEYRGMNVFILLTKKDERIYVHRDGLRFKKSTTTREI